MVGRTGRARPRGVAAVLAALLLGALLAVVAPGAPGAAQSEGTAAAPTPTAERANGPFDIVAIGDSITTATGTGDLGEETPQNSWVTGTNGSVNSMRARLGLPASQAVNVAANGERMQDFDDQANQVPTWATYVVVELGGNDLCRPSVAEMTSVAAYRQQLRAGLAALRARVPNALIFVASIPDIYNLWYIRGAEAPYNPNPSPRRSGLAGAHTYWDFPLIDVIPCQSLVDSPTDSSPAATARRLAVRQRTIDLNQVLAEECGAVLRCRFDDGHLFELSSNRIDPYANVEPGPGGYLPFGQREFTDDDISHNFGTWSFLCPAPGVVGGGTVCGDHFHPSLQGQAKLAEGGHEVSYQFGDDTFPDPSLTPQRGPDGGGVWNGPVDVDVTATDDVGVRGFEYRVHHPNGSIDPWTEHIGGAFTVAVAETGTTYVEARAMDVNGNLSASESTAVTIAPEQFHDLDGTVLEQGSGDPLGGITVDLHAAGSPGVLASTTTAGDGTFSFPGRHDDEAVKLHLTDADESHLGEWAQNAATHGAASTFTNADEPTVRLEAAYVCEQAQFGDVAGTHPFAEDICWLVGEGITTGYQDGTYRPAAPVTRQAMAAFIFRLAGGGGAPPIDPTFDDVDPDHPFYAEVEWAAAEGVISGYGDQTFRPGRPVTRQAMAAFMFRLVGPDVEPPAEATFPDVPVGHPFFDEVEWLASTGITTGFGDGTFRPSALVTRQSMAAFLHRLAPFVAG